MADVKKKKKSFMPLVVEPVIDRAKQTAIAKALRESDTAVMGAVITQNPQEPPPKETPYAKTPAVYAVLPLVAASTPTVVEGEVLELDEDVPLDRAIIFLHGTSCPRQHGPTDCHFKTDNKLGQKPSYHEHLLDPVRVLEARKHWRDLTMKRIETLGSPEALLELLAFINKKGAFSKKDWLFTPQERYRYENRHTLREQQKQNQEKELAEFLGSVAEDEKLAQDYAGGTPAQVNQEMQDGTSE